MIARPFVVQFRGGERRSDVHCIDQAAAEDTLAQEFAEWERLGRPAIPNNPMIYNAIGVIRYEGRIIHTSTR